MNTLDGASFELHTPTTLRYNPFSRTAFVSAEWGAFCDIAGSDITFRGTDVATGHTDRCTGEDHENTFNLAHFIRTPALLRMLHTTSGGRGFRSGAKTTACHCHSGSCGGESGFPRARGCCRPRTDLCSGEYSRAGHGLLESGRFRPAGCNGPKDIRSPKNGSAVDATFSGNRFAQLGHDQGKRSLAQRIHSRIFQRKGRTENPAFLRAASRQQTIHLRQSP